ncbi:MAG: hypothetical protein Kow0056_17280 [Coriobacteriia bacterium]
MARCWEIRDCFEDTDQFADAMGPEGDLPDTCAHPNEFFDRCPTKCAFTWCEREQHEETSDPALLFDPTVDRSATVKDVCLHCAFFLKNGPRL